MSNREKCMEIIDSLSEALDDSFCEGLYQRYLQDPDRGQEISIEEAARQLGIEL